MKKQYSAGGILLNNQKKIYILRNINRNEYILPKGKIDIGENTIQAAIREIKEETGYKDFQLIQNQPIYMSHYQFTNEENGNNLDKYVTYFLFKLESEEKEDTKEMEEEGLEGFWMTYADAIEKVTHADTKNALISAIEFLENQNPEIIILGGNSSKNLDWVKVVKEKFQNKTLFQKIQYYNHWTNQDLEIDLNLEAQKLYETCKDKNDFTIFAKSAGIMVTLKAIKDLKIEPKKCIFVGFPIKVLEEWGIDFIPFLKELNVNSIFFQNSDDPTGSFQEIENIFKELNLANIEIIEEKGDSHDYVNYETYEKRI